MSILSNRIQSLSESATLAMASKSRKLKAKGVDVINLSIGEPDFNTPECVKDAAKKAIDDNHTHYTPVSGMPELKQAIADKFKRDNGLDYTAQQIVVSNGAKQSIANTLLCLVDPGDEVIVPSPYWVSYPEMVKLSEGKMVEIKTTIDQHFKITPEQLENAITEKTKVFLFNSPSNPTGAIYTKDELRALADVLVKHENIFIISDEIYEYITFNGKVFSIAAFDELKDRVITINGVSKGFAMTGWRIGYLAANEEIAKACNKLQGQITSGASSISQYASLSAVEALECTSAEISDMVKAFYNRRELVIKLLSEIPGIKTYQPDGAFYIFPNVADYFGLSDGKTLIENDSDFCLYLLDKAHVAIVPGSAFGNPNCVRISYATSNDKLIEAIDRIKIALADLS